MHHAPEHVTPENTGTSDYEYDFVFYTETWHARTQSDQAYLSRTDHGVAQGFVWYDCHRETAC